MPHLVHQINLKRLPIRARLITIALFFGSIGLLSLNTYANANDESLEYKLACINAGRRVSQDDITIARFKSLLRQLSETFVENGQQIADMSVKAQKILREDGISESLLNIMEGMNQIFSSKVGNQKYAEYIAAYLTMRNKGHSHTQAIASIRSLLRSMGIK
ncbi:MAG: hypothetical protein QME75_14830 [Deltaproteobacteria bacterium]|nr:hypothetical protein [Deltaproteobacteria bacterium]